jgi:hypothetical protein
VAPPWLSGRCVQLHFLRLSGWLLRADLLVALPLFSTFTALEGLCWFGQQCWAMHTTTSAVLVSFRRVDGLKALVTQAGVKISNWGMTQCTLSVSSSGLCAGGEQVATQHAYC